MDTSLDRPRRSWAFAVVALAFSAALAVVSFAGCSGGSAEGDGGTDATTCPVGQTACSGTCSDMTKDPENCGACGTACPAGQVCSKGSCALDCATGTKACGQSCTNVSSDNANCGSCGNACSQGKVCSAGACGTTCQPSETMCGADGGAPYCANTQTDNVNCGACGNACPQGQVCSGGQCETSCQPNETMCTPDGGAPYCANTQTDNVNCGTCGNACPQGQVCSGGQCETSCQPNETMCTPDGGSPYCANTQSDNVNCGTCGNACPQGQVCSGGQCETSCQPNETMCTPDGGSPYCANTQSDNANCGTCGNVCAYGSSCASGTCSNASLRPNVLLCGTSTRSPREFFPGGTSEFNLTSSCTPDDNTQAIFFTRNYPQGSVSASGMQTYVSNGGIVLTEYSISQVVWAYFFGSTTQGARFGNCQDTAPTVNQFTSTDPVWQAISFSSVQITLSQSGCGYAVQGYPGITTLAGWDATNVAIGYENYGAGRVYATDFDWQDGETGQAAIYPKTDELMGYFMTHRR